MMATKGIFVSGLLAISALAVPGGHAEEKTATRTNQESPSEQKIAESLKKLVFVPHDAGAPAVTDAGGVRAVSVLPKIELIAPERIARTLSPTPRLYWHVSKASEGPARFTLIADDVDTIDPLLEVELGGFDGEGIYSISLGEHGITLDHGARYVWSIALSTERDSYGSDLVAQTVMEHHAAPDLAKALDGARPEHRAIELAANGYWYDAVDALSTQIEANTPSPWRSARKNLLDRAGLLQAARFDGGPAGPGVD